MQVELNTYFDALSLPTATKVAFSKARRKLKIVFFEAYFAELVTCIYQQAPIQRFKGFRLWACDGSVVQLPDRQDTRQLGTHTNQHATVASVKLLCYFDLLNQVISRFWLKNKQTQQLRLVAPHIADIARDVLSIYDRHYGSHLLLFLHHYYHSHCLIRLKVDFSNQVKAFLASGLHQCLITETLNENAWRELRKMGFRKSKYHLITYQLIRVSLSTGETEVLMSSLPLASFSVAEFADLYGQRWGIETCFDYLKNTLKAAVFSGYSAQVCSQDLWAIAIIFNLQTILIQAAQPLLQQQCRKRQKRYQINRNVGLDSLKRNLKGLVTAGCQLVEKTIAFLIHRFLQSLEPIKEGVSKPRKSKILRANDRHQTEFNYKPAI